VFPQVRVGVSTPSYSNFGLLPPAEPRAQGWTGNPERTTVSVWLRWASSSRHRSGQVLADLAPWAKVVQTVVCSTFTHGAKPATRRVADGERMNPGRSAYTRRGHGPIWTGSDAGTGTYGSEGRAKPWVSFHGTSWLDCQVLRALGEAGKDVRLPSASRQMQSTP
jgi:hypothetical protein